jgi:superfamily II DNA/RNA helicase
MEIPGYGPLPIHFKKILKTRGYTEATAIQTLVCQRYFGDKKKNATSKFMAQAPTGSGKTLCFMLGILDTLLGDDGKLKAEKVNKPACICVLPVRELAVQMQTYLGRFGLDKFEPPVTSRLLVKSDDRKEALVDITENIVFGTPGILCKYLENGAKRKVKFPLDQIESFVLDEADNLLASGMDTQTLKIKQFIDKAQGKGAKYNQMYFSATFSPAIETYIGKISGDKKIVKIRPTDYTKQTVRKAVTQYRVMVKSPEDRAQTIVNLFPAICKSGGCCLVFLSTRKGGAQVHEHFVAQAGNALKEAGLTVRVCYVWCKYCSSGALSVVTSSWCFNAYIKYHALCSGWGADGRVISCTTRPNV